MAQLTNDVAKKMADSSSEDKDYTPVPEGKYQIKLTSVETKTSSSGNPMWNWVFTIVGPKMANRKLWMNTVILENTLWKLKTVFDAFEVPGDTDTDKLIGCTIEADVTHREYNGKTYEDIARTYVDSNSTRVKSGDVISSDGGGTLDESAF